MASFDVPVIGQPNSTEDSKVVAGLLVLDNLLNSSDKVPFSSLAGTNVQAQLGVNDGTTVSRGKSIIATEESRTNTAYATLTTPDQVSSVVLPSDGLITIVYQALWKSSVAAAGRAAIFLGANQLKTTAFGAAPQVQAAATKGSNTTYSDLFTGPYGLDADTPAGTDMSFGITTGLSTGHDFGANNGTSGACSVWAAAGTYDISVQFKASSGSVTAKERKLWVKAEGY